MDSKIVPIAILLSLIGESSQQYAAGQCLVSMTSGEDLVFVFRLNPNGISAISGLQTYDATETSNYQTPITDSGCSTTSLTTDGVYQLTIPALTGQRTCGLVQNGADYQFVVLAEGADKFYIVTCNSGNLQVLPSTVSEDDYGTLHPAMHLEYSQVPVDVQFDVFMYGGTNAPVDSVYLGQQLRLQLIYNRGFEDNGMTNWGYSFHTAFLLPASGNYEYALEIVTPGLGTLVDIEVGDAAWTRSVFVKRNHKAYVTIPAEFVSGTVSPTVWQSRAESVKIVARDDRIGVTAITSQIDASPSQAGSHVVLPDPLLGNSYTITNRIFTGNVENAGAVVVIFTEASTLVTFNFGGTLIPTTIAGESVMAADPFTLTNGIDDNSVLRVYCGDLCGFLKISADKPVAIVEGFIPTVADGIVVSQAIPINRLGQAFVLTHLPTALSSTLSQNFPARATQPGDGLTSPFSTIPVSDVRTGGMLFNIGDLAGTVVTQGPMSVILNALRTSGGTSRSVHQVPSISQWGIQQSFYASVGYSYRIVIVAEIGHTGAISVTIPSDSLAYNMIGDAPNFNTDRFDALTVSSVGDPVYELYSNDVFLTVTTENNAGLVEFRSGLPTKPFMLQITTYSSSGYFSIEVPFGQRYPTQCTVPSPVALNRGGFNYGNTVPNTAGDNLDNDCDGKVDEEELNNQDDDNDGLIDEDLAISRVPLPLAVKVITLEVAADPTFTGAFYDKVIEDGCVTDEAIGELANLGPFTHRTNLDAVFDDYWVQTSPVFRALKYPEASASVYFRVTFGFCGDPGAGESDSECTNSCQQPGRRRRQVKDHDTFALTRAIKVKNGTLTVETVQDDSAAPHPCRLEPILLVPAALILLILLVECITLGYILTRRFQMMPIHRVPAPRVQE